MPEFQNRLTRIPELLLSWYDQNARKLPWRENHDPYRIWVSEIMLQQTRVEAVKKIYYRRFLEAFPDVFALANAAEDQVLKMWEGLGYYSRARNMQKAARLVVSEYGGEFPHTAKELAKLPGIGHYTAGAIASIAFDCPEPAVDGNVLRVLARLLAFEEDVSLQTVKNWMTEKIRTIIPENRAGDFNQSLMELGAIVCIPNGEPLCSLCPLVSICEGNHKGIADRLPVKTRKKERIVEQKTVFVLMTNEQAAFCKRPNQGLLAGMWEFPNVPGALDEQEVLEQIKNWGLTPVRLSPIAPVKHIFTHREWNLFGWLVPVIKAEENEHFLWANQNDLVQNMTIPSAFSAFLKILKQEWNGRDNNDSTTDSSVYTRL